MEQAREILKDVKFHVRVYREDDGTATATVDEMDIVVNEKDENEARVSLVKDVLEYAKEYYDNFTRYSTAPNRKDHLRYVVAIAVQRDLEPVKTCSMPSWKELRRFCERDGWLLVKSTDHDFYEKELSDGTILRVKVSRGSGEIHRSVWSTTRKAAGVSAQTRATALGPHPCRV